MFFLLASFCSAAPAQNNFHKVNHITDESSQHDLFMKKISYDSLGTESGIRNFYIGKMGKNEEDADENPDNATKSLTEPNPGFEGNVTLGYQLGVGDYGLSRLKLDLSAGYRIDPHISLGVGIGARQYPDLKATLLPVYADFRGWLLTSKVSPFFSFQVGTMFHASEEFKNVGIFVSPNLGVTSRFSDGTSMHFTIGYEYQRMGFYKQGAGYIYKSNENCGAVSFNVGFAF